MAQRDNFFNLTESDQGLVRQIAPGISARIFVGDKAMLSFVTLAPDCASPVHTHTEEQWGVLLEGDGVRIQGDEEINVRRSDFWLTPSMVPHGFRAGASGARVLDIFAPPREDYKNV